MPTQMNSLKIIKPIISPSVNLAYEYLSIKHPICQKDWFKLGWAVCIFLK